MKRSRYDGLGVLSVSLVLQFVAVLVLALLLTSAISAWQIRRAVARLQSAAALKALHEGIAEARSWNSRLLSTIRWAAQQVQPGQAATSTSTRPSGPAQTVAAISQAVGVPVPPDVAKAAAAGGMEEVEVPDALVNIAKGAGVDIGKVLAGDDAEMSKAKTLLNALAARTGGAGANGPATMSNGFSGPPPGEEYL